MRSERCSTCRQAVVRAIRSISRRGLRACRRAFIDSKRGSWWCSTSIACSTSASTPKQHEFATGTFDDEPKKWAGSPAEQREAAMKTCLVADDSSVIRKVARRILEKLDFQIVEAEDGEQALEACRSAMPDAVLLDWNMPKMDGYEFLRNLRRLPDGDHPKVVFCTTENDVAHIARALHAGANEYIMKPFDK